MGEKVYTNAYAVEVSAVHKKWGTHGTLCTVFVGPCVLLNLLF